MLRTARRLDVLVGQELTGAEFRVPQLATTDLAGWTVAESACYGKHLLLRLSKVDRRVTLHSHLRMDGSWRVYRGRFPGGHTVRVVLRAGELTAVGDHLHEVALLRTADEGRLIGHLGPDLLGPGWDPDEAVRRLAGNPHTPIGEALLDQRNLAGIGNLWKAEVLFAHRTSPWTPVGEVPDLLGLVERAQVMMSGPKRTEYVYGRAGRPCRRCGAPIKVVKGERITYWCPSCQ